MPFFDAAGEHPIDRFALVQRTPELFQLAEPFSYIEPAHAPTRIGTRTEPAPDARRRIVVPAHDLGAPPSRGNASDLASVPPFLWGLIAPFGHQTGPALLHDHLSYAADELPLPDAGRAPATAEPLPEFDRRIAQRVEADRLFRVALVDSGVSTPRAGLMWAVVSLARYRMLAPTRSVSLLAHGIALVVALDVLLILGVAGLASGGGSAEFAGARPLAAPAVVVGIVAAVLAAAVPLRGRDARPLAVLTGYGVPLLPVAAFALLGTAILHLVELLAWRAAGGAGARPRPHPTVLFRRFPPRE